MSDKKLSELPIASVINPADVSVLVSDGVDYQYAFTTLLQLIGSNITVGANISFGTTLPQNTIGKNGDVFINTGSGSFAQKIAGAWAIVYTLPSSSSATDGTILYGLGIPGSSTGNNNDTYINTGTGIFYKKTSGTWSQVFSMQTGPAGTPGTPGTNGTNGTNGNTVLNGPTNPSNSIGNNGDYYINNSTSFLFGPKAAGAWPAGYSIIGPAGEGIASGGTAGQVLTKIDNTDFNTQWINPLILDDTTTSTSKVYSSQKTADLINAKQDNLGFIPENSANKNAANGYAGLDGGGKVAAAQLPSYVDDVLEFSNFTALPGTGETGKIYVTLDTNKEYRWSGSTYIQLVASPGSTDVVPEGSLNLYFTIGRVLATLLAGISFATGSAVISTDSILVAVGKLQAQITSIIATYAALATVNHFTATQWFDAGAAVPYGQSFDFENSNASAYVGLVAAPDILGNHTIIVPMKDGTMALISDIPTNAKISYNFYQSVL